MLKYSTVEDGRSARPFIWKQRDYIGDAPITYFYFLTFFIGDRVTTSTWTIPTRTGPTRLRRVFESPKRETCPTLCCYWRGPSCRTPRTQRWLGTGGWWDAGTVNTHFPSMTFPQYHNVLAPTANQPVQTTPYSDEKEKKELHKSCVRWIFTER